MHIYILPCNKILLLRLLLDYLFVITKIEDSRLIYFPNKFLQLLLLIQSHNSVTLEIKKIIDLSFQFSTCFGY